ncbi:cation/H(+) antiporter 15 [Phtheirospermum japonicum]|uniref:Cation/H(+) antiporter 15 n=1 Tax=Phtheirospermum japonicum TaxID=374723 RepID=A0A830CL80_9LAMI|nr:cation/H(+) antiporter 15 [Phtheirospermum japonicum]
MGSLLMEPEDVFSYVSMYEPAMNNISICLTLGMVNSRGIFHGSNPFDYSFPLLLAQLSLASLVILFTSYFLKPLGQPSMVIQILGGLVLGPSFFGRAAAFTSLVYPFKGWIILDTLAVFGCMVYLFLMGVQIDPSVLKRIEKKDIYIGLSTVSLALVLSLSGTFVVLAGKFPFASGIASSLPAVATSSSVLSFPVIAHYLTELKMVNSEFGRMALSSSLISNLFGFCVISTLIVTKQHPSEILMGLQSVGAGLGLAGVIIFLIRPIIVWQLRRHPEGETLKQGFIFMVFVGILVSGLCSQAAGFNILYGPLIYGIALPAGPPLGSALMEKLNLLTSWLFMPLYFVKNGLVTDIFSVQFNQYWLVQSIIFLACIGKFLGALISSLYNKVPPRDAIQIGLVMNVQGVLELALFKLMKHNKAIEEDPFIVMCISMLVVTAIVTPILKYLYDPLRRHALHKRRTVMDLKPDSDLRLVACVHDQENVPTIIDLVESLRPTKRSPIHICLIHLVEMVGRAHPILITHKLNKVSSRKASTSKSIVNAFKQFQERYDRAITVHPFTAISTYATMHDEVCEMAIARRASLIVTPYHQRLSTTRNIGESSGAGMKIMNDNILEMAPCTVAIIVDRYKQDVKNAPPVCSVAVFFMGGPDDREALAIGSRMVSNPNINLTIVRVVAETNFATEDLDEIKFDNDVVNEFRSRMAGNQRVAYFEEVILDGTGTVAVIRSIEDHYDLIIVGRFHDTRSPLMLGLSAWEGDTELGVVGGMFVLSDHNSSSKILVVQQVNTFSSGLHKERDNYNGFRVSTSKREGPNVPLWREEV